jgi:ABC-type transport system involved in cytochrome c biogenesis permease subunit
MKRSTPSLATLCFALALLCLLLGTYAGLFVAPAEEHMGEVQRIMYVHVPTASGAILITYSIYAISEFRKAMAVRDSKGNSQ